MIKYIVFDFDGTLADTFETTKEIIKSEFKDATDEDFESFKDEELFHDAVLEIRKEPVRGECKDCHHNFGVKDFAFLCPSCSSPHVRVASGRELYIDYYEGD